MAFAIPKIVYGDSDTEHVFEFPPEIDDGDQLEASERVSKSISGVTQVSVDHIEVIRAPTYSFMSDAIKTSLETFYSSHGLYGKRFKYFDNKDAVDFVYYEVADYNFKPKRGTGRVNYPWKVACKFRRVLGFVEGESESVNILNNQAVATNLTDVIFDKTEYTSVIITGEMRRKTDSEERVATITLTAQYRESTDDWIITKGPEVSETECGVEFSITSLGQVQYTSDNMSGSNYTGVFKIKQSKFEA